VKKFRLKKNQYTLLSIGLLALLSVLFLWRVAFRGDILLGLDMLLTYEPWHSEIPGAPAFRLWNEKMGDTVRLYPIIQHVQESWRSGEFPFWYPYSGIGLPVFSESRFQVLYPVNRFLWFIMPLYHGVGWSAILHLFLGSLFTFLFLGELGVTYFGRLVAGISFTYSSSLVMFLGLPQMLDTMVWLPFIFWAMERALRRESWRWSLLAGLGVAVQILAGQIQVVYYTFTVLILFAICRVFILWRQDGRTSWSAFTPLYYTFIALAVGSSLTAFQLLPVAEIVPTIRRGEGDYNLQSPSLALLRVLIPDLFGTTLDDGTMTAGYRFELYLYLGLMPLFFMVASLFSSRRWLAGCFVGLGVFFLLVIFNVPPFYQLFYYLYPTFRSLGLSRIMFIIGFLWAAAAGIGADWLLRDRPERVLKWLIRGGLILGGLALAYLAIIVFLAKYQARHFWNLSPVPDFRPSTIYHLASIIFFLIFLGAVLALLWAWTSKRISPRIFAGLSIGLIVIDLFITHIDVTSVFPKHMFYPTTPSLDFLLQKAGQETQPFRISGVGKTFWPNTSGVFSLPAIQIYDSFLSHRYVEYAEASGVGILSNTRIITFKAEASRLVDALNMKYLYTPRDLLAVGDGVSLFREVEPPQIVSDYAEAGEVFEWSIDNWTQDVLIAPAPSAIHYQGMLPGNFQLETAVAVDPQFWEADGVLFEVYATLAGQEPTDPVFSKVLNPRDNTADRQWVPVQVDLSEFAKQPMVLSFVTKPEGLPGVRGGWADPMLVDTGQWKLLYYGPNSIYQNEQVLPRAWAVSKVIEVPPGDTEAAKSHLADPDFDPAITAIIEGDLLELPLHTTSSEEPSQQLVNIINYHPSHIEIFAEMDSPGLLVLSELYYPGWNVYVDGVSKPLYATNLTMRGVYVPSGEHQIEFIYEPLSFRLGIYISLVTGIIIVVFMVSGWWFNRRKV